MLPYLRWRWTGALAGLALILYGFTEIYIVASSFRGSFVQQLCAAGWCPDEFSTARLFALRSELLVRQQPAFLADLRRALQFDVADAYRWADLGEAEAAVQDIQKAQYCFDQAVARAPRSPAILFRSANFAFSTGHLQEVMQDLRVILQQPELGGYYGTIFLTYMRLNLPIATILHTGVPPLRQPAAAFLRFVEARNDVDSATAIWTWMKQHRLTDDAACAGYLDLLIANKKTQYAAETWKQYTHAADYLVNSWIYNGSFEEQLRNSPFDWMLEQAPHVQAAVDHTGAFAGKGCIRVDFLGGENVDYRGVHELAPVQPGQWILSGYIRTDQLTTDQGVSLHAIDIRNGPALDAWSQEVTGTQPWTKVEVRFTVRPETDVIRVDLVRRQSLHFDNQISGTAWLDAVTLRPARSG